MRRLGRRGPSAISGLPGTPAALPRQPALAPPRVLGVAAAVALTGTLTELHSESLDDNFTIPLACGVTAMLLL